jgi:hypothetical protein
MKGTKNKKVILTAICIAAFVMILAGCTPNRITGEADGLDKDTNGELTSATAIKWSTESDCGICHTAEADAIATAGIHYSKGLTCISCHDDELSLATVHEDLTAEDGMPKKLKKTEVSSNNCTVAGCHDDEAARVVATEGLATLTDSKGTAVNPHAVPQIPDHVGVTCSSCHAGHATTDIEKVCVRCHHTNVYECNTCH